MDHELKIWPEHFGPVSRGEKKAEWRLDDRPYSVGDRLHLREYDPDLKLYTGKSCLARVTHIARGGLLPDGYALLSIELLLVGAH